MKNFLSIILVLFLVFSGYVIYDNFFNETSNNLDIEKLNIEESTVIVDNLYVYGTHFNMEGNIIDDDNLDLVLYNGDFISIDININESRFNISEHINDGLYLEDIPIGKYYMFIRSTYKDENGNNQYKYYSIKNNTNYDDTTYYTLSRNNNRIVISNDEEYSTIVLNVTKNDDSDIYDIVLDPGHGGKDGGASKFGYDEDDFTLDIALKVKEKLEEKGIKVKLTREEGQLSDTETLDRYGIHSRTAISYEVNAKYLFSFHLNSNISSNIKGIEVYTPYNINYDFAQKIVKNIVDNTGLSYSNNIVNKVMDGVYTRTFTQEDIEDSIKSSNEDNLIPYDITTETNYYFIIRETGGIITGAYADDRNKEITANEYCYSNIGAETYLLELGYISNKSDLDNLINNIDSYISSISNSIIDLYNLEK